MVEEKPCENTGLEVILKFNSVVADGQRNERTVRIKTGCAACRAVAKRGRVSQYLEPMGERALAAPKPSEGGSKLAFPIRYRQLRRTLRLFDHGGQH